jgi:hypothetical protein
MPSIIRMMKQGRISWARHVARMEGVEKFIQFLDGKPIKKETTRKTKT